jgi:spore protease
MESAELVRAAVGEVHPDLVIAVDALAARSPEKLGAGVQLCDCGIQPGGGVGAARRALDLGSIGVPVMALGVPLVVESSTLVCDALRRAGQTELSPQLRDVLERGRSFFVCPKEVDLLVEECALLLAGALEKAFAVQ